MKSKHQNATQTKQAILSLGRRMILHESAQASHDLEILRGRLKSVIYDALEYCGGACKFPTTKKPKPFTHEQTVERRKGDQTTATFKAVLKRVYWIDDKNVAGGKHAKVEAWHIDGCWNEVGPFELDDFSIDSLDAIALHMAVFAKPKGGRK